MNDKRLLGLAAFVFLLISAVPATAAADGEVTGAELRRLAAQAQHDPAARRALADVRLVDGRPVDLRLAVDADDEDEVRSRLRTLAGGVDTGPADTGTPVDKAEARDDARRILEGRDFKPARAPRPFRGALRQLGEWLRPVFEPIGRWYQSLTGTEGPPYALLVVVLVAAVVVARRMVHRRTRAAVASGAGRRQSRGHHDDPDALEAEAEAAERAGELDRAVRLRFRAGLLRLDRAGAVEVGPSLTTGQLTRRVPSEALRDLAATFDEVAYGGRPAGPDDLDAARRQWPRALEEASKA